jgi:hypothetical protein
VRRRAVLAFFASALVACSGTGSTGAADATDSAAPVAGRVAEELPTIMAAAIEELVTESHTLGEGPPAFTEYLLQSHTDVRAGSGGNDGERRPLTAAERDAIEDAVRPFGPLRWIDDPDEWRTDDLRPTTDGSVILGVGEPTIDGRNALGPCRSGAEACAAPGSHTGSTRSTAAGGSRVQRGRSPSPEAGAGPAGRGRLDSGGTLRRGQSPARPLGASTR